jgi:acyl-[acyl carrier protein]--UDP-N-acetylglucosamine O-acyltransferase
MVGLRRGGFNPAERLQLRQLYKMLFRGTMNLGAAVAAARSQFPDNPAKLMLDFIATSKRGVCVETYRGERIDDESDEH